MKLLAKNLLTKQLLILAILISPVFSSAFAAEESPVADPVEQEAVADAGTEAPEAEPPVKAVATQPVVKDAYDEKDPWRPMNQKFHNFNEFFDRNLLKPVAKGYVKITPKPVRKGITNFFSNLGEPVVMLNDLLQAKPKEAGVDLSRFLINTTIGLGGIFDVATKMNLQKNSEDLGQTFGKWGVPTGPYVVIPFLGPSNVRDGLSKIPSTFISPGVNLSDDVAVNAGLYVLSMVNMRANLLDLEKMLIGDRYTGMRNVMIDLREHEVRDGKVEDTFMDEDDSWLDED